MPEQRTKQGIVDPERVNREAKSQFSQRGLCAVKQVLTEGGDYDTFKIHILTLSDLGGYFTKREAGL